MEKLKVKIRTNQLQIDTEVYALESLKAECSKLIPLFDNLGLGITTELLRDVCSGSYKEINKIVRDQLKNDLQTTRTASTRQFMTDEAEQSLSMFNQACEKILHGERRTLVEYLRGNKGLITTAPEAVEAIKELNTYYLENSEEIAAYNAHLRAVEAMNEFLNLINRKPQILAQVFLYSTDVSQAQPAALNYAFMLNNN